MMKYQVYVIELSKRVFTENTKFRTANPQFNGVLECLYVGMTSKTPAERFKQHKTGYVNKKGHKLSANIVQKYGIYLRPSLYDHINLRPMTRQQALMMEEKLALDLRRQGYAVWFNWYWERWIAICYWFLNEESDSRPSWGISNMKKLLEIILMILVCLSFILVSLAILRLLRFVIF